MHINIDPQSKILWEQQKLHVDGEEGWMYTSPNMPDVDPEQIFNHFGEARPEHECIGVGQCSGLVHAVDNELAIKSFDGIGGDKSYLRANVLLAEGLKRTIAPPASFSIRGLEIYAAYMPRDPFVNKFNSGAFWLMERIVQPDTEPYRRPRPNYELHLYRRALGKYSISPDQVRYDIGPKNLMVEEVHGKRTKFVKIDVMPNGNNALRYFCNCDACAK